MNRRDFLRSALASGGALLLPGLRAFDVVNVSKVATMLKSAAKAPRPASGKVV